MRGLLIVLLMLSLAGTASASLTGNTSDAVKAPGTGIPSGPNPGIRIAGDTVADPFATGPLPFTATGATVGFFHDYDEVCPYSGSMAPDVVYAYSPPAGAQTICIDLCYSSFDTKVYVYDNSVTPGAPYACNDDFYFAAPCYLYSSKIENMPVTGGHTYYIVVDGYGSASGAYQLDIFNCGFSPATGACCVGAFFCTITTEVGCEGIWQGENTACVPNPCSVPGLPCPVGALIEGEPTCQDNYIDNYNGGCNSTPVIWQALAPQVGGCADVCGHSCTYLYGGASTRDTDWFLSTSAGTVTQTMTAVFPFMMAMFTGTDCGDLVYTYYLGAAGGSGTLTATTSVGVEVGFFAANSGFSGWPGENDYVMNVCGIQDPPPPPGACCNAAGACIVTTPENCAFMGGTFQGDPTCTPTTCIPVPTERKSWGAVKSLYR